jgi:histone H2B
MEELPKKLLIKRKKTRYWEIYISKVLKQVSPKSGITSNSKQQLNSVLCQIAEIIATVAISLTIYARKKTIDSKEVNNALRIVFPGELAVKAVEEGSYAVNRFKQSKLQKATTNNRQDKAGIIFPPSIAEKFLRKFGYCQILVTSTSPICFAAALEYITSEILELAKNFAGTKRVRITIRDMELAVRNDVEFNTLFRKNNISFLGGGGLPFIHSSLLVKKPRKKQVKDTTGDVTQKHRFRPGTVALREIRKFQKMSNCLTFARFPFEKLVRRIVNQEHPDSVMKISKEVFIVLQYFIEQNMVELLRFANDAAVHSGRVKLIPNDIKFIDYVRGKGLNPYIEQPYTEVVFEDDEVK